MPRYDYECETCGTIFEASHNYDAPPPPCPNGHATIHRIITTAPRVLKGMAAAVSYRADKEELRAKWTEETPKLRKKLADKLGEDTVNKIGGTINTSYDQ